MWIVGESPKFTSHMSGGELEGREWGTDDEGSITPSLPFPLSSFASY